MILLPVCCLILRMLLLTIIAGMFASSVSQVETLTDLLLLWPLLFLGTDELRANRPLSPFSFIISFIFSLNQFDASSGCSLQL